MKYISFLSFVLLATLTYSCSGSQKQNDSTILSAIEFSQKISALPSAPLIDVRTTEEFAKGHLVGARNIDVNGNDFEVQIASFDKTSPILLYCLSGSRSEDASAKLRLAGFSEIYQLKGGILKWRAANLPEAHDNITVSEGLSLQQFDELLRSDKLVLVDFYADWCGPCKKMKPYLDDIATEMPDKVAVIRINTDDNQALAKALHIEALPTLQLYTKKILTWTNTGYLDKDGIVSHLQ